MTTTSNLGLSVTSEIDMETITFLEWRLKQMGDGATSNAIIINNWASKIAGSLVDVAPFFVYTVEGYGDTTYISSGSSSGGITALTDNMVINLVVNNSSSGSASLTIGSLGEIELQKYDPVTSTLVSLESMNIIAGRRYFFIYKDDLPAWIWVGASSSDQMYIPGEDGDTLSLEDNTIVNSGSSVQEMSTRADNIYSGSFVTWGIDPLLPNSASITSGSGISIVSNTSASEITVHVSNSSIVNSMMADEAVDTDNYIDGSIQTVHLNDEIIGYDKIVDTTRRFLVLPHISGSYPALDYLGYKAEEDDIVWAYGSFKVPSDFSSNLFVSALGSWYEANPNISGSMYINYGEINQSFGANSVSKSFIFTLSGFLFPTGIPKTIISASALLTSASPNDYVKIALKKGAPESISQEGTVYLTGFLVTYTADS